MGNRYLKKNLGDPNWSKPNNYKIKQNDAIYDVEIVPNKGVKGDVSAQPFNDQNATDIEDALVALDDDLAFVEADYINNAEHALKQDKTDNALTTADKTVVGAINELVVEKQDKTDNNLNTTDKTVVGAINEVKTDSEYYDSVQDDAIAIVNNKINALPRSGSLKNIRTSSVGIPTSFTNIDMFNTKQTVANYQPSSLDYKGTGEPHIVLMKSIGDYVFDFSIEANHTNGTDTTITLEAWVDGVLYDTATRTLVGASNQINGITGFFQYSKGTDTVPSEIYFRFKASQGNTSANKAMINTNLQGNNATTTFTDTDHVTGVNLTEPTYNGVTTTFIINDLDASKVNKSGDTMTGGLGFGSEYAANDNDVTRHLLIYDAASLGKYGIGVTADNMNYVAPNSGQKHNFKVNGATRAIISDSISQPKDLITKEYADFNYKSVLNDVFIGYDDSLHATHLLQDILKDIIVKTQIKLSTTEPFIIKFSTDATTNSPNLNAKLREYILEKNGVTIPYTNLDFKIESSTTNGQAYYNTQAQTKVTVWNREYCFSFEFDYDSWSANKVTNENLKQIWSLDELGLDGTWVIDDAPGNIKKAYDKIVTLIGTGTTFTITQSLYRNIDADHYEFSQSIEDSIIDSYGTGIGTDVFEFSITFGLYNDLTGIDNTNYILIKSSLGSFTRQFNFNGWSGTKWSDASGALSAREARFLIGNGNGTFSNTITLTDSAFNYRKLLVRVVLGGSAHKYHEISTNDFSLIKSSMLPYAQGTAGVSFHSLEFELSANGTSITLPSTSTHYVTFTRMDDNAVSQTTTTDCGIVEIYGIGRLLPEGTTHSLFGEPKIETPNIEPEVGTND